jgi:hypothetical protein
MSGGSRRRVVRRHCGAAEVPSWTTSRGKTLLTEVGPVEGTVSRNREVSCEPQIVKNGERRLPGPRKWSSPCRRAD